MFKPVSALLSQPTAAQPAANADADVTVKRLFMLFHGWYGNLFLSKFATGDLDADGKDRGIKSARIVWTSELRDYEPEVVMDAAARCKTEHAEFPPSLPQFIALCKAVRPRPVFRAEPPANRIGMSDELRSQYSRRVREQAMAKLRARIDAETGLMRVGDGLDALKQLIAKAAALAGADEGAELARLDRLFDKGRA